MPRAARRSLFLAAVVIGILAFVGGRAFGGSLGGATPQLHAPAALGGAPHVSTPSVPNVSVPSVPSVPSVSVPSTPSVPSVPSAPRLPSSGSVAGTASGAAGAARGAVAGAVGGSSSARTASGAATGASRASGASESGASATGGRSSASGSGGRGSATTRAASHAARRDAQAARERRLRRDVARLAGCLGELPRTEGRLLSLRAGLEAAPVSRTDAARQLGISTDRARVLERRGLRRLRHAGSSGACRTGGPAARRSVALAAGAGADPQLQPAVLLGSRPALTSPAALSHPRQGGRGASRQDGVTSPAAPSGSPAASSSGHAPGVIHSVETGSSTTVRYVAALVLLALLMAALLFAWRRRDRTQRPPTLADQTGSAAVWQPPAAASGPAATEASVEAAPEARPAADQGEWFAGVTAAPPRLFEGPSPKALEAGQASDEPDSAEPATDAAAAADPPDPAGDAPPRAAAARTPATPAIAHRRQRRPATVAVAGLASLGLALLRRRRRR